MDIGDVISDSLRYPSSDWIKVLILGVLFIISFLIIPLFLAMGYMFRVIKASLAGVEELPTFDEWGEMFVDGIKLFLVYLIYSLPAIIIGVFSIISLWSSIRSLTYVTQMSGNTITPEMVVSLFGGTALVGLVIAGIYALIIYPIMAVAIGNMAYYNGELSAAFRFGEIFSTISSIGWVDLIIWYIVNDYNWYCNRIYCKYSRYNPNTWMDNSYIYCLSILLSVLCTGNCMVVLICIWRRIHSINQILLSFYFFKILFRYFCIEFFYMRSSIIYMLTCLVSNKWIKVIISRAVV